MDPQQPSYFLRTERLGFRRWCPSDLPLALKLWGDIDVTRLFGGPFSAKDVEARLAKEMACLEEHGFQYWPLFLLENDDLAGVCGLRPYPSKAERILELGFHLRPIHWGKGLAFEAAQAVIKFARESLRVDGLFAGHHPENVGSAKVLMKLGFELTHEELYPPTGRMHKCYLLRFSR